MKEKIQAWNDKYSEVKGTPEFTNYLAERHAKINGRWQFVGHGIPSPAKDYTLKKYKGTVYLVSGDERYVIKSGTTDLSDLCN